MKRGKKKGIRRESSREDSYDLRDKRLLETGDFASQKFSDTQEFEGTFNNKGISIYENTLELSGSKTTVRKSKSGIKRSAKDGHVACCPE